MKTIIEQIPKHQTTKKQGPNVLTQCPFCETGEITIKPKENTFYCFKCLRQGNARTFKQLKQQEQQKSRNIRNNLR